jgi:thiol-disulfide isomerase/thioredoxin|nr:hypothetical protein [uncultured Flavobacterium sp.]
MKHIITLVLILFFQINYAQKIAQEDTLSIENYIRNPYRQDRVGQQFPMIDVKDSDGVTFDSTETKRVAFYNFWCASCQPCITEIPMLMKLKNKYKS